MDKGVLITLIIVIGLVVIFLFGSFSIVHFWPSDDKGKGGSEGGDKK